MKSQIHLDEPQADLSRHDHLQYKDLSKYITLEVFDGGGHAGLCLLTRDAVEKGRQRAARGMITIISDPVEPFWRRWF